MKKILPNLGFALLGLLCIFVLSFALTYICVGLFGDNEPENTWSASAEFYQLESGQDRFSEYETNVDGTIVIVDHDTGIQYLSNENGMTVLLEEDGTPKRVAEAG